MDMWIELSSEFFVCQAMWQINTPSRDEPHLTLRTCCSVAEFRSRTGLSQYIWAAYQAPAGSRMVRGEVSYDPISDSNEQLRSYLVWDGGKLGSYITGEWK